MASGCCSSEDPLDGHPLRIHPGVPRLTLHIHELYAFPRSRMPVHIEAFCIPPPVSPSSSLSQTGCPTPFGGYPPAFLPRPLPCHLYGHKDEETNESSKDVKVLFRKRWQVRKDGKNSLLCTRAFNQSLRVGLL